MKKFFPVLFCCVMAHVSTTFGQIYSFQYSTEPYVYLNGDSSISDNILWYNDTWDIPIGFNFKFMGHDFDQLTAWNESLFFDFDQEDMFIFPYIGAYLLDKGIVTPGSEILSPISIKREGAPGNRIFKFQCRNAGFEEGGPQDSVNFQIWLYETSNIIEFRFGPVNIVSDVWDNGFDAPGVGFQSFADGVGYILGGNPTAPTANLFDPQNPDPSLALLSGPPPEGAVWRFMPQGAGLNPLTQTNAIQISNPNKTSLQIWLSDQDHTAQASIFDGSGKILVEKTLNSTAKIDLTGMNSGIYYLVVKQQNSLFNRIFIKE